MRKHCIVAFGVLILCLAGCHSPGYFNSNRTLAADSPPQAMADQPRQLPIFAGHDGSPMNWHDLLNAVAWAEVIVLGEQHDDAMGHAVQLAIVQDVLDRWPSSAVSLEMLERDEQVVVDDYLDGIIDQETFARLTFSSNWGGEDTWDDWFQPVIDAARDAGSRVIAANAPRRYVRLARTHGYDAIDALPPQRRRFVDRPGRLPRDGYFERFRELMSHTDDHAAIDAVFRSQMVWDATMAASIVRARPRVGAKVVHLVGQFHSDFEGGLIQQLRSRRPGVRILVVSLQRNDALHLRDDDRNRADVVIYTGKPPEPDEEELQQDDEAARDDAPQHDASGGDGN